MTNPPVPAPWHLWLVGAVAVLFNAIGAVDYTMSKLQGDAYMASVGMTPEQITFMLQYPMWMLVVWPIGVWGAVLGSVLLLLRRKLALPAFLVSTAAWFVSLLYTYVLTNGGEIMGSSIHITSVVITAFLLFFIWYSWVMSTRNVLR